MKKFECTCGNRLFFENTECLSCKSEVGWCPVCRNLVPLLKNSDESLACGRPECGAALVKCRNYAVEQVCNHCCIPVAEPGINPLCCCCRLTVVIPDMTVPNNRKKWYRLEVAKRRLLHLLDLLKLPYGRAEDGISLPLSFDFKADVIPPAGIWRTMADERVYTGHQDGKITINLREADDAEREKLRIDLNEAHRTLCGHFRHEIGHYYWQMLVPQKLDAEFAQVFGDPEHPSYAEALEKYYLAGAPADWQTRFVSPYAGMHPWEDFAETFSLYLDMAEVLDTASESDLVTRVNPQTDDLDHLLARYLELAVAANELNRSMGLIDLVPEVVTAEVRRKMAFVHDLVRKAARGTVGSEGTPPPQKEKGSVVAPAPATAPVSVS